MKRLFLTALGTGVAVIFLSTSAFAGSTYDPWIQQRGINQQKRIYQGIWNGQLNPWEARILKIEKAKVRHREKRMKWDCNLSLKERARLARKQDRLSRHICWLKHNRW
jgi:hypothetical protein